MSDVDFITPSSQYNPFNSIIIGSFDLLSGIKIVHRWIFQKDNINNIAHDDMVKITLSNVHRQKPIAIENYSTSSIDVKCYNWYMINSIFVHSPKTQTRDIYFSVGMIFDSSKIRSNPHLNDALTYWDKILSYCIKIVLARAEPFSILNPLIEKISNECTKLVTSQMPEINNFDLITFDSKFYEMALTAHLQTQMTTVIESTNSQEAINLAQFLSNFMLPIQKNFSTLEIQTHPVNGLFLQCVERQKSNPEDFLIKFSRPTTWIRLPEKQIYRLSENNLAGHSQFSIQFNQLFESIDFDENDRRKQLNKLKSQCKTITIQKSSEWATSMIAELAVIPKCVKYMFCEQQLNSLLRKALAFIAMKNERLEKNIKNGNNSLTKEQILEIQQILQIPENEDLLMIVSLARMYDENVYTQIKWK
ncbi:hypothetical protein TRFO_41708 [Tritrichomonas foetus]|uniref:Uncharacterized protein n=1 Tax=Tritrichomonas foetus TaxID=1144522 RepID=A0A1J4L3V3_9EUKA|nr:hypothetical protein TRFO_41708 [Tritrichomonas foetus]|eukprot:OHT16597.1 hypothetical protein TRFO_41708 [Tritrichomonas foetus]